MDDKKAQEHTFLENGKVYYNMISEERIREIIQEEIAEYNEVFMSQMKNTFNVDMSMERHGPGPDEDEWVSATEWSKRIQERKEKEEFNDAQMINGTFEGDTISQIGKRRLKQSKKGLNTDSDNPDSGE